MVGDILQCMINPAVATDLARLGSAIRRQTLKSVGTEFGEALYECRHAAARTAVSHSTLLSRPD
jgi:hypothetical protein